MSVISHIDFEVAELGELNFGVMTQLGYGEYLVSLGPTGYWRCNESAGTVLGDSSGHGRHGQLAGDYSMGQPGMLAYDASTSLLLEGNLDGTRLPVSDYGLPGKSQATVMAWMKPDRSQPDTFGDVLFLDRGVSSSSRLSLVVNKNGRARIYVRSAADPIQYADTATVLLDGEVYFIACVVDLSLSQATFYVNGILDSVTSLSFSQNQFANTQSAYAGIGRMFNGTGFDFKGTLGDVAVFNKALSSDQLLQLYRIGAGQ